MKVTLKVLGKEWSKTGTSVEEALSKFDLDWVSIKGKGTLTISKGKNSYEHCYNMAVLRRIFNNKITRMQQAKWLTMLFESGKITNIPQ